MWEVQGRRVSHIVCEWGIMGCGVLVCESRRWPDNCLYKWHFWMFFFPLCFFSGVWKHSLFSQVCLSSFLCCSRRCECTKVNPYYCNDPIRAGTNSTILKLHILKNSDMYWLCSGTFQYISCLSWILIIKCVKGTTNLQIHLKELLIDSFN